jgi:hypothetical protein
LRHAGGDATSHDDSLDTFRSNLVELAKAKGMELIRESVGSTLGDKALIAVVDASLLTVVVEIAAGAIVELAALRDETTNETLEWLTTKPSDGNG